MFQSFDESANPDQGPARLAALRRRMAEVGVNGFLVPRADAHQGEYVPERDARLSWLTGFTGSAGFAAILEESAGVFVDSRYRLQVREQVATEFTPVDWPETRLADWLISRLGRGKVGFDPWLHSLAEIRKLEGGLAGHNVELQRCDNLVDDIWPDQPAPPREPIETFPETVAGETAVAKIDRMSGILRADGHTAAILTLPDSICWLLNIRGSDIPRNPLVLCNAILYADGRVSLFVDPEKSANWHPVDGVSTFHPDQFTTTLASLSGPVTVDPGTVPVAVTDILEKAGCGVNEAGDPCIVAKARKNSAEITATREAHLRDGAAMCEFLCWLDGQDANSLSEIDVVKALEGYRRATNVLRDISFDTICGSGPNGAIVHYRVTEKTNRQLRNGELLLVDSGGQYVDGTTDITRTVALGAPPAEAISAFTRVLKGMIAISRLRWPAGLAGRDIDAFARAPLWAAGQDYGHGTGHGVGVFLCVHEGPQRLSRTGEVVLEPGMILSNEPGFYKEGAFGIRIENLIVTRQAAVPEGGNISELLEFETLTFVPIDLSLVDRNLLSADEVCWINRYHDDTRARIGPRLTDAAREWLDRATRPL